MNEYELNDGSFAVGVELPIPPYETALIIAADTSAESKAVLEEVKTVWNDLWPEMLKLLKNGLENIDSELDLQQQEFIAGAQRTEPGYFMSDKSDIYLSFSFPEGPDWDYFIRGSTIVHFQPVF